MAPDVERERRKTTVLFGDIVGSTALAASLGDQRWAMLLEEHQRLVREEITRRRGQEMDTAGDGFFAIFGRTGDAVLCAEAIRDKAAAAGLELRLGVHAGSCWVAGSKCTGLDVSIGARVSAAAAPGEILLSEAAAAALAGDSGFRLSARGAAQLKGVPEPQALFVLELPTTSARRTATGTA